MRMLTKILGGAAGLAALGAAAPAAAQWGYSPYAQPYAYSPYAVNPTTLATQQCAAAVQARLNNRVSIQSILGAALGVNTAAQGRVISFTQVVPRSNRVTVRGLATSGRMAGYGPYGVGAYGALGYGYQPDLSFRCSVDYQGRVRDVDINRRY